MDGLREIEIRNYRAAIREGDRLTRGGKPMTPEASAVRIPLPNSAGGPAVAVLGREGPFTHTYCEPMCSVHQAIADTIRASVEDARAEERDACARLAEAFIRTDLSAATNQCARWIAGDIRSRSLGGERRDGGKEQA